MTIKDEVVMRLENEAARLPIGSGHRFAHPGQIDLEKIEVQVGRYTGEPPIVRVADG